MTTNLHDKMLAAIDAYFSASDAVEEEVAENLLLDVRDEINKHKLAAESLNEGLRLDDWDKIGCVNHDCDKCKAQQVPLTDIYRSFEQWKNGNVLEHGMPRTEYYSEQELSLVEMGWKYGYDAGLAEQPAQQEPVHEFAYKAITKHGHHCHFGTHEAARSWAGEGGEVETIKLRHFELVKTTDTSPQPAQRKQLTDEEIDRMYLSCKYGSVRELARAIEAAHGITKGNT